MNMPPVEEGNATDGAAGREEDFTDSGEKGEGAHTLSTVDKAPKSAQSPTNEGRSHTIDRKKARGLPEAGGLSLAVWIHAGQKGGARGCQGRTAIARASMRPKGRGL